MQTFWELLNTKSKWTWLPRDLRHHHGPLAEGGHGGQVVSVVLALDQLYSHGPPGLQTHLVGVFQASQYIIGIDTAESGQNPRIGSMAYGVRAMRGR